VVTAEGREALTEAVFAADLVRDHRQQATRYATQRARAVMRANQHGASYRQIAEALSVSIGMVQQWMRAALRLDEEPS
jgi:DNA-binding NarL/FixJ family response regulator